MSGHRSVVRPILLFVLSLLGASCNQADRALSEPPTGTSDQYAVRITPAEDTLFVQTSKVFSATVTVNGAKRNVPVDWRTTDPTIATVTGGTVTALAEGETQLIARAGTAADTATVVVYAPFEFFLSPAAVSAMLGDTISFELTTTDPSRLAPQASQIAWSISDTSAAQFIGSGVLHTLNEGEVQVTARRGTRSASAVVRISRAPVASIVVTPGTLSIAVGSDNPLSAEVRDIRGRVVRNRQVLWSTSDALVAVVSPTGVVTASGTGSAVITATSDAKMGTSVVNVFAAPAHSVSLKLPNDTISVGAWMQASATAFDERGRPIDRPWAWQSSNPSVASISNGGMITALAAGQTNISVIIDGKIATQRLTVISPVPTLIVVTPNTAALVVGSTTVLSAQVQDQFGSVIPGIAISWSSTAAGVASVNAAGLVTAVGVGSTTIRAQAGSLIGTAAVTVQLVPVATVTITPASATLNVGGTWTFTAVTRDAAGNVLLNRPITWTTSNSAVATVSASGVGTGVGAGTATITATSEAKSASATVTVSAPPPAPVASVTLALGSSTLTVGQTTTATARTFDSQGNELFGRTIAFSSANSAVASVSSNGTVSAVGAGSTTITATSGGKSGIANLVVQAPPPASVATVTLTAPRTSLQVGDSTALTVTLRDAAGNVLTGRTISFSTSNAAIATVTASGTVRGVAPGNATITATSEGKNGPLAFTITAAPPPPPPPVSTVTVTLNASSLVVGTGTQATAVLRDAGGNVLTGVPIVWSSSNTAIATVSQSGYVTAVAAGSVNIIATSGGKTGSASLTVTNPPPAPVATVTVTAPTTTLQVGDSTTLTVVLRDSVGNVLTGRPITFASSNTAIATVNLSGKVTGVAPGSVTLTATSQGKNGTLAFTVTLVPVASVTVTLSPTTVTVGSASQATAVLRDANGNVLTGRPITWSSSNTAVATVTAAGAATGVTAGTASITATSGGNSGSATLTVQNPAPTTGSLTVTVNGLPGGTNGSVTVTGPGGFSQLLTATNTLSALVPGAYIVTAASVSSGGTTYNASVPVQNATVTAGATASVTVTYVGSGGPPPSLNLTIDGMHVQQAVQTYTGTVPLVTGRDGLLRVFVKASTSNSLAPAVRVRFYSGATLTSTVTLSAPSSSVPTSVTESVLNSSWNYLIPASLMQPGLKILADVDPSNAIAESSESDNSFPVSGNAATMNVQNVALFSGRMVPVIQSVNGLQGGVTTGNLAQYTAQTKALYPLASTDIDVRAPFTTNAPVLQPNDGNGAWGRILSEISALRTADGSTRFYYGVVPTTYNSGVAGLGLVGGRSAIGWDFLPSASDVMAHEVGHNFGRTHAPSCGAGSVDPSYPYVGGAIGVFGYDMANNVLKPTSTFDIMGNCDQAWISDYTYTGVLNYRVANPLRLSPIFSANSPAQGILVWGRIENGQLILEPTFEVTAPPSLPSRPGRHRIQAFGSMGERLFELSFEPERVADSRDQSAEHFAFVVPLPAAQRSSLSRLVWTAYGRQVELMSNTAQPRAAEQPLVERMAPNAVRVSWREAQTRGVLIRDARTGDILSFGRGGDAVVYTREASVDLDVSDGVRSVRQRVGVSSVRPLR